jgi:sprouty-related, EVH1 domain-containing protein
MTRDESTEGWLPAAGGGLANVSIRKRPRMQPDVGGFEYIIYGQRISDQTVNFATKIILFIDANYISCCLF